MRSQDGFPPRGWVGAQRDERAPDAHWANPEMLGPEWDWAPGKLLLGMHGTRLVAEPDRVGHPGRGDDRHITTTATTRGGKSVTILIPNLKRYPGSAIVLDPKGELVRATAAARRALGQDVHVLDPFGVTGEPVSAIDPVAELTRAAPITQPADTAQLAEALIIGHERDPHWTDAAKNLIRGLTLHMLAGGLDGTKWPPTLRTVHTLMFSDDSRFEELLQGMTRSTAFDGAVTNTGTSFLSKLVMGGKEFSGILSTAQEQLTPIGDVLSATEAGQGRRLLRLEDIGQRPTTVYLVLPGSRIPTHFRWLRLVLSQALIALERKPVQRDGLPVLFVLEEFAALGYMRPLETAAGLMAGYGVRLWTILQDFTQLKVHYPKSWETFLGNSGIIQAFGTVDLTTTRLLSDLLGQTQYLHVERGQTSSDAMRRGDLGIRENLRGAPLLAPTEITRYFARETGRQLILVPGRAPLFLKRLPIGG